MYPTTLKEHRRFYLFEITVEVNNNRNRILIRPRMQPSQLYLVLLNKRKVFYFSYDIPNNSIKIIS